MLSKKWVRLFLLFGLLLSLGSCSLYEGPAPQKKKDFAQGNLGCLKNLGAQLENYVEGRSSVSEIHQLSNCAISALQAFTDYTRGQQRDRFSAEEVRNFLQRYFLEDVVISDSLLKELMVLKKAVIGGTVLDFTRPDFDRAKQLILIHREVLILLLPHMPIRFDAIEKSSPEKIDELAAAIRSVGLLLSRETVLKDGEYSFKSMGRLFEELIRTFPKSTGALRPALENLEFAGILKEALVLPTGDRDRISSVEWQLILREGAASLATYAKLDHALSYYPTLSQSDGRIRLREIALEFFQLLEGSARRHRIVENRKGGSSSLVSRSDSFTLEELDQRISSSNSVPGGIPMSLMRELLDVAPWDGKMAGIQFERSTLKKLIEPTLRRVFGGTDPTPTGRKAESLTPEHVGRMVSLFEDWYDSSRYLEGLYLTSLQKSDIKSEDEIPHSEIDRWDVELILKNYGGANERAVDSARSLKSTLSATLSLMHPDHPWMLFDGNNRNRPRMFRELQLYTFLKPILRRVVVGYQEEQSLRAGLKLPEFQQFVTDYWQILLDFKFVGPSNSAPVDAKKRFVEASLFTQISDGNEIFSVDEGMQLIFYLMASSPLGDELHSRVTSVCEVGAPDEFGKLTVEPTCYRNRLYHSVHEGSGFEVLWKPFPLLLEFYRKSTPKQQARFRSALEIASRKPGTASNSYFNSGDTDTSVMIFHYVESLFLRFDANQDGFLDKKEAKVAFPVFRALLAEKSGKDPENSKMLGVFYWLLSKGSPPVREDMGAIRRLWNGTYFLLWDLFRPDFKADRLRVIEVFAALSAN